MPRTFSNKKDSRIGKTDRDIKRAMLELIRKEPYSQIRIEQIMKEAPVTKVTFYKHFASKDDVLDSIRDDIVSEMRSDLKIMPEKSLWGGVILFYHYSYTDDPARKKLLNTDEYSDFAKQLREEYFASDFFRTYCDVNPESFNMVSSFISDVCGGIYRRWYHNPATSDKPDLDTLADMTAKILMGGLKGLG